MGGGQRHDRPERHALSTSVSIKQCAAIAAACLLMLASTAPQLAEAVHTEEKEEQSTLDQAKTWAKGLKDIYSFKDAATMTLKKKGYMKCSIKDNRDLKSGEFNDKLKEKYVDGKKILENFLPRGLNGKALERSMMRVFNNDQAFVGVFKYLWCYWNMELGDVKDPGEAVKSCMDKDEAESYPPYAPWAYHYYMLSQPEKDCLNRYLKFEDTLQALEHSAGSIFVLNNLIKRVVVTGGVGNGPLDTAIEAISGLSEKVCGGDVLTPLSEEELFDIDSLTKSVPCGSGVSKLKAPKNAAELFEPKAPGCMSQVVGYLNKVVNRVQDILKTAGNTLKNFPATKPAGRGATVVNKILAIPGKAVSTTEKVLKKMCPLAKKFDTANKKWRKFVIKFDEVYLQNMEELAMPVVDFAIALYGRHLWQAANTRFSFQDQTLMEYCAVRPEYAAGIGKLKEEGGARRRLLTEPDDWLDQDLEDFVATASRSLLMLNATSADPSAPASPSAARRRMITTMNSCPAAEQLSSTVGTASTFYQNALAVPVMEVYKVAGEAKKVLDGLTPWLDALEDISDAIKSAFGSIQWLLDLMGTLADVISSVIDSIPGLRQLLDLLDELMTKAIGSISSMLHLNPKLSMGYIENMIAEQFSKALGLDEWIKIFKYGTHLSATGPDNFLKGIMFNPLMGLFEDVSNLKVCSMQLLGGHDFAEFQAQSGLDCNAILLKGILSMRPFRTQEELDKVKRFLNMKELYKQVADIQVCTAQALSDMGVSQDKITYQTHGYIGEEAKFTCPLGTLPVVKDASFSCFVAGQSCSGDLSGQYRFPCGDDLNRLTGRVSNPDGKTFTCQMTSGTRAFDEVGNPGSYGYRGDCCPRVTDTFLDGQPNHPTLRFSAEYVCVADYTTLDFLPALIELSGSVSAIPTINPWATHPISQRSMLKLDANAMNANIAANKGRDCQRGAAVKIDYLSQPEPCFTSWATGDPKRENFCGNLLLSQAPNRGRYSCPPNTVDQWASRGGPADEEAFKQAWEKQGMCSRFQAGFWEEGCGKHIVVRSFAKRMDGRDHSYAQCNDDVFSRPMRETIGTAEYNMQRDTGVQWNYPDHVVDFRIKDYDDTWSSDPMKWDQAINVVAALRDEVHARKCPSFDSANMCSHGSYADFPLMQAAANSGSVNDLYNGGWIPLDSCERFEATSRYSATGSMAAGSGGAGLRAPNRTDADVANRRSTQRSIAESYLAEFKALKTRCDVSAWKANSYFAVPQPNPMTANNYGSNKWDVSNIEETCRRAYTKIAYACVSPTTPDTALFAEYMFEASPNTQVTGNQYGMTLNCSAMSKTVPMKVKLTKSVLGVGFDLLDVTGEVAAACDTRDDCRVASGFIQTLKNGLTDNTPTVQKIKASKRAVLTALYTCACGDGHEGMLFFNKTSAQYSCTKCKAGYKRKYGEDEACVQCPAGEGLVSCPLNTFRGADGPGCESCPAGSYAYAVDRDDEHEALGQADVEPPAVAAESCHPCPLGYFRNAGMQVCRKCPAGTYQPVGTTQATSDSCLPCPAGEYSSTAGASACNSCPAGSYCPAPTGAAATRPVPGGGGDSLTIGALKPTPCAAGQATRTSGAQDASECAVLVEFDYSTLIDTACSSGSSCRDTSDRTPLSDADLAALASRVPAGHINEIHSTGRRLMESLTSAFADAAARLGSRLAGVTSLTETGKIAWDKAGNFRRRIIELSKENVGEVVRVALPPLQLSERARAYLLSVEDAGSVEAENSTSSGDEAVATPEADPTFAAQAEVNGTEAARAGEVRRSAMASAAPVAIRNCYQMFQFKQYLGFYTKYTYDTWIQQKGDGRCNPGPMNTVVCNFDDGDCCCSTCKKHAVTEPAPYTGASTYYSLSDKPSFSAIIANKGLTDTLAATKAANPTYDYATVSLASNPFFADNGLPVPDIPAEVTADAPQVPTLEGCELPLNQCRDPDAVAASIPCQVERITCSIDPATVLATSFAGACDPDRVGNGRCDCEFNIPACNYDGGDCCMPYNDGAKAPEGALTCQERGLPRSCITASCRDGFALWGLPTPKPVTLSAQQNARKVEGRFPIAIPARATVKIPTPPTLGRVSRGIDAAAFTYTPFEDACGTDTFTYSLQDAQGHETDPALVTITIACEVDCTGPNAPSSALTVAECVAAGSLIGNGVCDCRYNVPVCQYDGGDCCRGTCQAPSPAAPGTEPCSKFRCLNPFPTWSLPDPQDLDLLVAEDGDLHVQFPPLSVASYAYVIETDPSRGELVRDAFGNYNYHPAANIWGNDLFNFRIEDAATGKSSQHRCPHHDLPRQRPPTLALGGSTPSPCTRAHYDSNHANPSVAHSPPGASLPATPHVMLENPLPYAVSGTTATSLSFSIDLDDLDMAPFPAGSATRTGTQYTLTLSVSHGTISARGVSSAPGRTLTQTLGFEAMQSALHAIVYTPDEYYHSGLGAESLEVSVSDLGFDGPAGEPALTASLSLPIIVAHVNHAPNYPKTPLAFQFDAYVTAQRRSSQRPQDKAGATPIGAFAKSLLQGDDVTKDNDARTFTGSVTYTPKLCPTSTAAEVVPWVVSDGMYSDTVAVTITVHHANPTAYPGYLETNEDTAVDGTLPVPDPCTSNLEFRVVQQPLNGTVVIRDPATGTFTYTPNAQTNHNNSFTYTVTDVWGHTSEPAVFVVRVLAVNDPPVLTEQKPATVFTPSTVAAYNANPALNDAVLMSPPGVTLRSTTYLMLEQPLPYTNPSGTALGFKIDLYDLDVLLFPTTAPTRAVNTHYTLTMSVTYGMLSVSYRDGSASTPARSATLSLLYDELRYVLTKLTYVPDEYYHSNLGAEVLNIKVDDNGFEQEPTATGSLVATLALDISVAHVNHPPKYRRELMPTVLEAEVTCQRQGTRSEDKVVYTPQPITVQLPVEDPDKLAAPELTDTLVYSIANGVVPIGHYKEYTLAGYATHAPSAEGDIVREVGPRHFTGFVVYTPELCPTTTRKDVVPWKVTDGMYSDTIDISVNVSHPPPTAYPGFIQTIEDRAISGKLPIPDPCTNDITFTITVNGNNGTVIITDPATGLYTYTPKADWHGVDSFNYTVTSIWGLVSEQAVFTVQVLAINDRPQLLDAPASLTTLELQEPYRDNRAFPKPFRPRAAPASIPDTWMNVTLDLDPAVGLRNQSAACGLSWAMDGVSASHKTCVNTTILGWLASPGAQRSVLPVSVTLFDMDFLTSYAPERAIFTVRLAVKHGVLLFGRAGAGEGHFGGVRDITLKGHYANLKDLLTRFWYLPDLYFCTSDLNLWWEHDADIPPQLPTEAIGVWVSDQTDARLPYEYDTRLDEFSAALGKATEFSLNYVDRNNIAGLMAPLKAYVNIPVAVFKVNQPPELPPMGTFVVKQHHTLYGKIEAFDIDTRDLLYRNTSNPIRGELVSLTFNRTDQAAYFVYRPYVCPNSLGLDNFTFTVSDGEYTVAGRVDISLIRCDGSMGAASVYSLLAVGGAANLGASANNSFTTGFVASVSGPSILDGLNTRPALNALDWSVPNSDVLIGGSLQWKRGSHNSSYDVAAQSVAALNATQIMLGGGAVVLPTADELAVLAGAKAAATRYSAGLAALAANGAVSGSKDLLLTGTSATYNVFTLDNNKLSGANTITIRIPKGACAVINCLGAQPNGRWGVSSVGFNGSVLVDPSLGQYYVWNVVNATSVSMQSVNSWFGMVLSPQSAYSGSNNNMNGGLVMSTITDNNSRQTAGLWCGCPFQKALPAPDAGGEWLSLTNGAWPFKLPLGTPGGLGDGRDAQ
ncbi:hypothetical protein HYH03_006175 [Edaphochlamys debaryana]|uniref:LNR domain-containing protein n=1 Tax=Edaphochlamys debaryana TaxID=47281 RepID=A0A835YAZ0_9CHLO|nr:hypothetical protein HYH03_006175 [Edaphochlamys debaryana]|eukprot:KAG2495575.1 hypothetical protein HYH03_006175 [Edaphochlamys debaryana]